jgi:uncharacterized membrane protein YfcA
MKQATVLSQAAIAAVSALSIVFNAPRRHPTRPDATLIDYDACLSLTPALLLGVSIGVIGNAMLPTSLITIALVLLLVYMAWGTVQRGARLWRAESAAARAARAVGASSVGGTPAADTERGAGAVQAGAQQPDGAKRLAPYPYGLAAGVSLLWAGFCGLQVLRQAMPLCSASYWAATAAQVRETLLLLLLLLCCTL